MNAKYQGKSTNDPDHHGTPDERLKVVEVGIQGAIEGQDFSVCQVE